MTERRPGRAARLIAGAVTAAVGLSVLAGCSTSASGGGASGDKVLTVMWSKSDQVGMEAAVKRFEKANPGVTVKLSWMSSNDFFTEMRTRLAAGTQADVFMVWPGNGNAGAAQVLGPSGYLADLSDEAWVKDLPKTFKDVSTTEAGGKGKVVEFITSASAFGALYNTKAMKNAGLEIPTKWSEVIPFCKAARAKGLVAYSLGAATDPAAGVLPSYGMIGSSIYIDQPGFDLKLADGSATFPDSGWKDALDKNVEMAKAGCYQDGFSGTQQSEALSMWSAGKALGMQGIGLMIPAFTDTTSSVEFAPFPVSDDPSRLNITIGGQDGAAVNAKAKDLPLAKKFVAFLATPEENVAWAKAIPGAIPILMPKDYTPVNQFQEAVLPYVDKAGPFPDQYWPNAEVQHQLVVGMEDALIGRKSVDDVLKDMQTAYDKGSDQ